jgi:selenocysteine-specific elongation factor
MSDSLTGTFVVGTAGHIDHGKSTLVKALTSIDPDRLAEEKRRGMTIDLGFAYLDLAGGRRVAIVDVPGHQRFLKNMLAGVHGMDAVMLVIAADEGPMPQTREHLAIIDLLQIAHGVVVLAKADLVDEAWLALVREEVGGLLAGTSLQHVPIVAVSSSTGQGLDDLLAALDKELAATAPRPDQGKPRLPVDRSFSIPGFGTVVTGTLVGGSLAQGEEVVLLPQQRRARIRGLQQHNQEVTRALPGTRTAVNLSGIEHTQIQRGEVLSVGGSMAISRRLDARISVLPGAAQPIKQRQRLLMYHGTAEHMVELSLLAANELRPGSHGMAQLFADTPVVGRDGDRFILRIPSPAQTVAGGVLLDFTPRRHRRNEARVIDALRAREKADEATSVLLELEKHRFGLSETELCGRLGVSQARLEPILLPIGGNGRLRRVGQHWLTGSQWQQVSSSIEQTLLSYHRAHPLRRGMPREELRSRTGVPAELFTAAIGLLVSENALKEEGAELAHIDHRLGLTADQERAASAALAELEQQPFSPPALGELVRRHQLSPALVQYLAAQDRIVRVDANTVFARTACDEAVSRLRTHLREHRTLTVAAARDLLGSSRRYILPLLEWMDSQKITRRVGDDRILRD